MRLAADHLVRLRWLLLSAVSAGACGGTTSAHSPDASGGSDTTAGGTGPTTAGTAATAAGQAGIGGKSSSAGSGGVAGGPVITVGQAGAGGAAPAHGQCDAPQPADAGFVTCGNGLVHRVARVECQNKLPEAPVTCGVEPDTYSCDGSAREHCDDGSGGQAPPTSCKVGCLTDDDCASGELCRCGPMIGACVAAQCAVDADCSEGYFCREVVTEHGIGCGAGTSFQCQLPSDTCSSPDDCDASADPYGVRCQPEQPGGPLVCQPVEGVACGRPFLVRGTARLAGRAETCDWAMPVDLDASALAHGTRSALAEAWRELGSMEHASVAAFARFTLQLLSLGAPHALVVESNRALADETRHAEACFGLATAFGAAATGPGPLDVRGALDRLTLEDVVVDTFLEGCIGETVATLEANAGLAEASFTAIRAVLQQIAEDEARHAALAWRFVAWGVAQAPELAATLRQHFELELGRATQASQRLAECTPTTRAQDLTAGGIIDDSSRAALRVQALCELVAPCLAALDPCDQVTHQHGLRA